MQSCFFKFMLVVLLCHIATPATAVIQFRNFSNNVILTPSNSGHYLLNENIKVKLANRIIIKTDPAVTKKEILLSDKRVTDVTTLYNLSDGTYYAVTFDRHEAINTMLYSFASRPFVQHAQPDLLQLHTKTAEKSCHDTPPACIQKLGFPSLWEKTKGAGVRIAIIDDGFDLSHEDLLGTDMVFGYDMETKTLNPSPVYAGDTHGTRVAGVIFAQHNGIGTDGIAPRAQLIAIRHADTWTSKTILSFYLAKLAGADIVNCSWNSQFLLQPVAEAINDLTTQGRNQKGTAVVFAAGNNGRELEANSCEAALPGVITVGSASPGEKRLKFSNYGKVVDVFTFGKNIPTTTSDDKKYGLFSGTSASAAIVSGIIALLLSENPEIPLAAIPEKLFNFL